MTVMSVKLEKTGEMTGQREKGRAHKMLEHHYVQLQD